MTLNAGFVETNGVSLYYEVLGDGPPVVFLHGGLMDRRMWDDHFDQFAQRYRAIRYDLRGHGKSGRPPGPFSHYRELHGLLNFLNIESAALIGQSLGGRTALSYALEHPARVRALVLVAAGVEGYTFSAETLQAFTEIAAARKRGDNDLATELFMRRWVIGPGRTAEEVNPAVLKRARVMIADNYARPSQLNNQPMEEPNALARLSEIRISTLIVLGDHDVADIAAMADRFAQDIHGARKIILPGAHMVNMEQPEAFNRLVLEFL